MTQRPWHLVSVFPDLLGTYGDQGNVVVLERRLAWRGMDVRVTHANFGDPIPDDGDLYLLGGGEDEAQTRALERLRDSAFPDAVRAGSHVFAVCAGLQLLGHSFSTAVADTEGLGLLDVTTTRLDQRAVGEVLAAPHEPGAFPPLTGFTNHAGRTALGALARPLGRVLAGLGNTGQRHDVEGAAQGAVVGSYLHGPVLARNPALADWLLHRMVGSELPALAQGAPEQLHARRSGLPTTPSALGERRRKRCSSRLSPPDYPG